MSLYAVQSWPALVLELPCFVKVSALPSIPDLTNQRLNNLSLNSRGVLKQGKS